MTQLCENKQEVIFQWFGSIILLCMALVLIKMAGAYTAFNPQLQPTGYVAQNEVSNFSLTSGNETVYMADYEKEFWSGNLHAYPISATGTVNFAAERWTLGAAASIDAQDYDTSRLIATMSDAGVQIPFRYASLSVTQQALFPATTINLFAATGLNIVNFLRGDRSNEGPQSLRMRDSVLGDNIHSRPYYVADASYPTVFVSANDGMLHAINTVNGQERWAYVPSMLLPKMLKLAKTYGNPVNPHDYFVDGQLNVAWVSSNSRRVLVGGLGGGGRGLYGLDVTGLSATVETNVAGGVAKKILWEITPTKVNYASPTITNAYINLGYTYSTPLLSRTLTPKTVILFISNPI